MSRFNDNGLRVPDDDVDDYDDLDDYIWLSDDATSAMTGTTITTMMTTSRGRRG